MTVRSPSIRRWQDGWTLAIPRSRLSVGLTRRHILLVVAAFYLGLLVFVYLHLLGQVALLQYQTTRVQARWAAMVEENTRLEAQLAPYLSVDRMARLSEGLKPIPVQYWQVNPPMVRGSNRTQAAPAVRPQGPYVVSWARIFHLQHVLQGANRALTRK